MVEHACIAIGIDRYARLQPLRYAQADALAFQTCVAIAAKIPEERRWLLAETAPMRGGRSTYPILENIERSLDEISTLALQPEDILWCFFCGYGVNIFGKDYLMPIDGNPDEIQTTGISVETFFNRLQQANAKNLRVFFDISRPTGRYAGAGIGSETLELAYQLDITVMLSCRPSQFARETSALDRGLFTAALLEALDSWQYTTWEALEAYMSDRLPQLCDHHWRPQQNPVTVIRPTDRLHQPLFPAGETVVPPKEISKEEPKTDPQPNREPDSDARIDTNAATRQTRGHWLWVGGMAIAILLLGVSIAREISSPDRSPSENSSETQGFDR
ncbi:MAG: hypothetical protein SWY16_00820 [Cyanobacteriota bacterium]|nr:hypothetical protein [Cyanobacteriota bacterium]